MDPLDSDYNRNSIPDGEEDWDGDNVSNAEEAAALTDPFDSSSHP